MKIGILGTGDVGRVLGTGFAEQGYAVKMGTRNQAQGKVRDWLEATGPKTSVGSLAEAAGFGDLVVIATAWSGTENAIRLANPANLSKKVIIDVTNPLDFADDGPPRLALGHMDSGGEHIQRWLPKARVVKALNIIGNQHMIRPDFPGGPPDMFICGNDPGAKQTVSELLEAFGWPAVDIGGIEGARYLEPLAMLWVTIFLQTGNGNHAFKLLRK